MEGMTHCTRGGWLEEWHCATTNTPSFEDEVVPWAKPFLMHGELSFSGTAAALWVRQNYWIGPAFAFGYLAFLYFGQKYMDKRPAFDLKRSLLCWNIFCAGFSIWAAVRVVPQLWSLVSTYGVTHTNCVPNAIQYSNGPAGLGIFLFVLSKLFELVDTAFIVFRKAKLPFVHWYHHLVTLLFTWDTYAQEAPASIWYAAMNLTVHSFMYSYYALAMLGPVPSWGVYITVSQITQMVAGTYMAFYSLYLNLTYKFNSNYPMKIAPGTNAPAELGCSTTLSSSLFGIFLYVSFLVLFVDFFIARFIKKQARGLRHGQKHGQRSGDTSSVGDMNMGGVTRRTFETMQMTNSTVPAGAGERKEE